MSSSQHAAAEPPTHNPLSPPRQQPPAHFLPKLPSRNTTATDDDSPSSASTLLTSQQNVFDGVDEFVAEEVDSTHTSKRNFGTSHLASSVGHHSSISLCCGGDVGAPATPLPSVLPDIDPRRILNAVRRRFIADGITRVPGLLCGSEGLCPPDVRQRVLCWFVELET
eukprot:PhM_4_TR10602/c0_g1_i3/m.32664